MPHPNSCDLVTPTTTAPASRSDATTAASRSARRPASTCDP
jgi:hypothetical protein